MNIDEVYKFVQYISNKNQSGFLTPKDFNLSINRALTEWVMKRYNNVVSKNNQGWEKNQKISDDLRFLIVRDQIIQVDYEGVFDIPNDYLHLDNLSYNYVYEQDGRTLSEMKPIDIVRSSELSNFLSSKIYKRKIDSKEYAIACMYSDFIQVYPKNVQRVSMTYLRKPIEAKWAFTVQNRKPVYDSVNSVDIEAPDEAMNEIVMMCCSYLGMNLREAELVQYSETLKSQGV